jgi:hypothetical protein
MPTYKNDSSAARNVVNTSSQLVWVQPGQAVQTYQLLTSDGWTKTSDAPYYNPVLAVHSTITSTGAGDPTTITLADGTDQVEVYNNSDADITLLLNAAANTPGYQIPAASVRTIEGLGGYVADLVLQFSAAVSSGEVIVHELEE